MIRSVAVTATLAAAATFAVGGGPATAATTPSALRAGSVLTAGQSLRSPNGAYTVTVGRRLVVRHGSQVVWARRAGAHPRLALRQWGNLALLSGHRVVWSTRTRGANRLLLTDAGVLTLASSGGTVWSSRVGNGCHAAQAGEHVVIDLGAQFARLCTGGTQVLTTPITSGASALGDGTPTGTWRLQSKQRERYLYPAAGGAYYVHYWLPYDGVYGMHDSTWQRFPYGSQRYRTQGSHGCVHFPLAAIRWMYGWIRVGTVVQIHG